MTGTGPEACGEMTGEMMMMEGDEGYGSPFFFSSFHNQSR